MPGNGNYMLNTIEGQVHGGRSGKQSLPKLTDETLHRRSLHTKQCFVNMLVVTTIEYEKSQNFKNILLHISKS